jgi:hypothetical protein
MGLQFKLVAVFAGTGRCSNQMQLPLGRPQRWELKAKAQ